MRGFGFLPRGESRFQQTRLAAGILTQLLIDEPAFSHGEVLSGIVCVLPSFDDSNQPRWLRKGRRLDLSP